MKKYTFWLIVAAGFVVSVAADLLVPFEGGHGEFWWEHIPGFFAALGFIGCLAIAYVAKSLGKRWLQRKEDYYD